MTREQRREYARRWHQRRRDRDLAEKMRTAARCPKRYGVGYCNGRLETQVGRLGESITVCEWCERQKAGVCRYCSLPVAGARNKALYCAFHKKQIQRIQMRASEERHADERRLRERARYWANEERRAERNRQKALWRKANPEKVRAQKRRYVDKHRADPNSTYLRYHRRYRKKFAQHRRDLVRRAKARQRRPIPDCRKCGKPTGWTPVSALHPGRPWTTCMKCAWPCERKLRRKSRRRAAREMAKDPRFGLPRKPAKVAHPSKPAPRGPGDETICVTPGCDIVVTHRKKKCSKCRRREAELAAQELAKTAGRGRRVDLERVA